MKKKSSKCLVDTRTTTRNKETKIIMKAAYIKEYFVFRDDYELGSSYDKFMQSLTGYLKAGKNIHDDANDCTSMLAEDIEFEMMNGKEEVYTANGLGIF